MKRLLCVAWIVILSISLTGCGDADQGQGTKTEADIVSREGSAETEKDTSDDMPAFPESYEELMENVEFKMNVVMDADLAEQPLVTAKAQMQKVNVEKGFQLLYGNIDSYETYDYEEKNEYGETVHTGTYVSPEEITLSYGPVSSRFDYMERDLMPYVLNAFVLDKDSERYNADLYSTESQLSFMTREEAFEKIQNALEEIDIKMEYDNTGYALDYNCMQSQEYHEDMDGNVDKAQYKDGWSAADECYYFCINQRYKGLPLYHVYCDIFTDVADANAPIQAVVSEEGIEWLGIEKVFEFSDEAAGVQLAPMNAIVETVANKYNQVLGDSAYEITKAELYYYVDLSSGTGVYDVKPVWIITGIEKAGETQNNIQIIVDAQTAKEIVP